MNLEIFCFLCGMVAMALLPIALVLIWWLVLIVTWPIRWKYVVHRYTPQQIARALRFMGKVGFRFRYLGHGWYFFWRPGWSWWENGESHP